MEKGEECKCLYPFHISCTKLYVKYGEGMLGYCPIPFYPNSIFMIVLNLLFDNLERHYTVHCYSNSFLPFFFLPPSLLPLLSSSPPLPSPPPPFLLLSLSLS